MIVTMAFACMSMNVYECNVNIGLMQALVLETSLVLKLKTLKL